MTITHGPVGFTCWLGSSRSIGAGAVLVAIGLPAVTICKLCGVAAGWFRVTAKLLAHRAQQLLGKSVLLPRAETSVKRSGEHLRWHRLFYRSHDGPAAFARILNEARVI